MSLKPDIKQMLQLGDELGYTDLEGAHSNYMRHYDCFFLIDKFAEQNTKFESDIRALGWVGEDNYFKELTIKDCLEQLK